MVILQWLRYCIVFLPRIIREATTRRVPRSWCAAVYGRNDTRLWPMHILGFSGKHLSVGYGLCDR